MSDEDIVETRTLFYQAAKSSPRLTFIVGLRKDQTEYLDKARTQEEEWKAAGGEVNEDAIRGSEHLGNSHYVAPENMKEYECPKCEKKYQDKPVLKIKISEIIEEKPASVYSDYYCAHCNEWLATIPFFGGHRGSDEVHRQEIHH